MPIAIVDFSYLRASVRDALQNDLRGYTVLLTSELIYEVATDSHRHSSWPYFKKLDGLNVVHSRSLINLVKEEIGTSQRMDDVLHPESKQLVDVVINAQGIGAELEVQDFFERDEPKKFKSALDRLWSERHTDIFASCSPEGIRGDAKNYLGLFPLAEEKNIVGEEIAKRYGMRQVPKPGWLIYDWERLRNFLAYRYRLDGNYSYMLKDKKLANNLADLTYLAFANRVDAIATNDTALIIPLAQVFGPPQLRIIQPRPKPT
jgi:hypothetical protein